MAGTFRSGLLPAIPSASLRAEPHRWSCRFRIRVCEGAHRVTQRHYVHPHDARRAVARSASPGKCIGGSRPSVPNRPSQHRYVTTGDSVIRLGATSFLGLRPPLLGGYPSLDRAPRRPGGPPPRRWRRRGGPQDRRQPFPCLSPVGQLRPLRADRHRQHSARQPPPQPGDQPLPQPFRHGRRSGHVPRQLDPAVRRVDPLAARPGRAREAFPQFRLRNHEPRRHHQIRKH